MPDMIRVENLGKRFAGGPALDRVSLAVAQGRITIVAGADGAGKSTLFKILVGLIKRDHGEIFFEERPVTDRFDSVTAVTGYMPERFSLYPDLSVEENLNFYADINGVSAARREALKRTLLQKTGMLAFRRRRARALSGGMKQKLALSAILLSAPRLILLDEPTTGVDPLSRIEFFKIIEDLKAEGKTVVMATPYLDEAEKGDHIVFLKNGRVIRQGDLRTLRREFPMKILSLLPRDNIYETVERLNRTPRLQGRLYIRGEFIRAWQAPGEDLRPLIPHSRCQEEPPRLEDIYLYHERRRDREMEPLS